jgi:hypothetical protein
VATPCSDTFDDVVAKTKGFFKEGEGGGAEAVAGTPGHAPKRRGNDGGSCLLVTFEGAQEVRQLRRVHDCGEVTALGCLQGVAQVARWIAVGQARGNGVAKHLATVAARAVGRVHGVAALDTTKHLQQFGRGDVGHGLSPSRGKMSRSSSRQWNAPERTRRQNHVYSMVCGVSWTLPDYRGCSICRRDRD